MKNDGAFPSFQVDDDRLATPLGGLSLRDYFAAAALFSFPRILTATAEAKAAWAFQVADAMIQEREKP